MIPPPFNFGHLLLHDCQSKSYFMVLLIYQRVYTIQEQVQRSRNATTDDLLLELCTYVS